MIEEKTYRYVFVRRDLPLHQQMVQAAHAALEGGLKLPSEVAEPSSLIVIGVKDKSELHKADDYLFYECGIQTEMFFEPDWEYGDTAFCTEAIPVSKRKLFKRYQLWKP